MKKLFFCALLFASALESSDYWCLNRHLTLRADYGYMRRQEVRDLRLVEDTSVIKKKKFKKLVDTDDLVEKFDRESAVRGILTYHADACSSLEALYIYYYPWDGEVHKTGSGTLQFPFIDPSISFDYQGADIADITYKSWLQSGELNYWWHVTPQKVNYFSFSWNLGGRVMFLKEAMDLLFTKLVDRSLYATETRNTLYGLQLGAMLQINPSSCWTWTFIVKGAGFLNDAKNDVKIKDYDNVVILRDYSKRRLTDSWLLEGYAELALELNRWLSAHIGYDAYVLTGVATAPGQRDVSSKKHRRINVKDQIVIDGVLAGLSIGF